MGSCMSEPDLARLLLEGHRTLSGLLLDALEERGWSDVRPGHLAVFLHIDRRSGTRLTELARRARITKQAMMLLVDDLESRGYVRRVDDPSDGRARVVRLTARGRRAVADGRRVVQATEVRLRRELGDRRVDGLRESLELLVARGEPQP
jgi:DNA-binding MarR family transcriptional regulator